MTLPQETIDQLKKDAIQTDVKNINQSYQYRTGYRDGHLNAATEWVGKALGLVDILEVVHNMSYVVGQPGCTFCDTEYDSMGAAAGYNQAVDNMKKVISTALAKYKEVSNG